MVCEAQCKSIGYSKIPDKASVSRILARPKKRAFLVADSFQRE
jgi:hypothetical protein